MARRWWRGNGRVVPTIVHGPDEYSTTVAAALQTLTNPASPMNQGTAMHRYQGDAGFGVNRFAGRLPYPLQDFRGAAEPAAAPASAALGFGAGVSGQPGLPNTAMPAVDMSLALMSGELM